MLARFVDRPNRFVFRVRTPLDEVVEAYCPNTSRLIGLLEEGTRVWLTANSDPQRKTAYTVRRIYDNDHWVGLYAAEANRIYEQKLRRDHDGIQSFPWEREVRAGDSWIDFFRPGDPPTWVEVKSLSSRGPRTGWAFFSGTPSKRAQKHLGELARLAREGQRAECVFVVQRSDVEGVCIQEPSHESWIRALEEAAEAGVDLRAFRCRVTRQSIEIDRSIPVRLSRVPAGEPES